MRGWRWRVGGLLVVVLALASPACNSGPSAPLHVRLAAGPAAAASDSPIHIAASATTRATCGSLPRTSGPARLAR